MVSLLGLSLAVALGSVRASETVYPDPIVVLDRVIHQEKSLYRNILVLEGGPYRCLAFGRDNARQTCIDTRDPKRLVFGYTQAMLAALYVVPRPRRVLVVGLGGGVLPRTLLALDPEVRVDAVEIDPAVIAVARTHFGYPTDPRLSTFAEDGRVFVRRQRRSGVRYEAVLLDAFERDYVPEHLLTVEFLQEVRDLLAPGGVVAANTFATSRLRAHEAATYQAVFGRLVRLPVDSGNRILLATRDGFPSATQLAANDRWWQPLFAALAIPNGTVVDRWGPEPPVTGVRLLTDQYSPSNLLQGRP